MTEKRETYTPKSTISSQNISSVLHYKVLNQAQLDLLPLLKNFKRSFYLVGGTAIALQIGHRRSIDFDLFTERTIRPKNILDSFSAEKLTTLVTRRVEEQLNLTVNGVKFTFFQYPFPVIANQNIEGYMNMPDLLQLGAMKAYALGRRSKWKDYVDLFFILKHSHSFEDIVEMANSIFGSLFSEKQFRAQLMYFEDVDFTEEIEYLHAHPSIDEIKESLQEISLKIG
ncbi:MAG: nucleotidyl transferase AbiEii/AbiGii toxin family protein [Bacteroidetes bacterium]|nr:nucleotidyl transferase AbiEii/AbiGii toxin family protein [Bacteroidota bacterium]